MFANNQQHSLAVQQQQPQSQDHQTQMQQTALSNQGNSHLNGVKGNGGQNQHHLLNNSATGASQSQRGSSFKKQSQPPTSLSVMQQPHPGMGQQPMIILQQSKLPQAQGSFKIKKEDLKLLQQYCENDLSSIDVPKGSGIYKNTNQAQYSSHQKTKSQGATPLGTSFVNAHYQGKTKQSNGPHQINMMNIQQIQQMANGQYMQAHGSQQSQFLDYQKFLEEEKLFQNQKAKSSLGYYSVGQAPQSLIGGRSIQQSKSPDLAMQIKAATQSKNQQKAVLLSGSNLSNAAANGVQYLPQQQISQSALSNYSNVQNLLQQHSNRGINNGGQGGNHSSVNRPSSRKNKNAAQNLIYDQGGYPQLNYNLAGAHQQMYIQKNAASTLSQPFNVKNQQIMAHKNDELNSQSVVHNQNYHNTIEAAGGFSKDHLNESSNYLSDELLMKSNQQLHGANNSSKMKQQAQMYNPQGQYSSLQDESYMDASLYDQFIQGPHNISQFSAANGPGSTHKMIEDANSYSQFIQRPLSQNTNVIKGANSTAQSKLGRQSPAQKNNTTTRTLNAQMHSSQPKKSQRASSIMHNSLNNSAAKQQAVHDRRLVVGRTPSPNFLKRIAGLMNIGNDFILPQQNMFKNVNNQNLIVGAAGPAKRSQSKQAFSSNPQSSIHQPLSSLHQPIQQNFVHLGSNTIIQGNLDKNLKQKFLKPQASLTNAAPTSCQLQNPSSILALNASRFKSGSLTTSANTAQNSPRRDQQQQQNSSIPRNQAKQQKTTGGKSVTNQMSAFQSATDFHQVTKNHHLNNQQKLKIVNDMEEKKAMALVKGIKDYPSAALTKQQIQLQQQYLQQQQFLQPVKMIGEIMEEDPQPLGHNEFLDDEKSFQSENYYPQHIKKSKTSKSGNSVPTGSHHKGNSKSISHSGNTSLHMIDGGTGSNGALNHQQIGNTGGDAYSSQPKYQHSLNPSSLLSQGDPNNSISLYLEQLQNLRQNQKSQLSHHAPIAPLLAPNSMSPMVNKTSNQFFKPGSQTKPPLVGMIQGNAMLPPQHHQINIKPLLQQSQKTNHSKSVHQEDICTPLSNNASQHNKAPLNESNRLQKKKNTTLNNSGAINQGEPPKIATPSMEMYRAQTQMMIVDEKLQAPTIFQKKQQVINFNNGQESKTPFEKELDLKAKEIQNQKKLISGVSTQEQQKLQKYKEDSISILKQLQESGSIVISNDINPTKEQSMKSKKQSLDSKPQQQRLIIDMEGGQKKKSKPSGVNSPMQHLRPNTLEDEQAQNEVLLTQEEEQQIKEVISDINHKAFYGKIMKKQKEVDFGDENQFRNLSPRSREIALVQQMVKTSFMSTLQPPVTTIDFYRIGKMLGRGAFGKVNLAMHKLIRKLVAIKSLNKECLTDEAQKQKLMKEVSLLLKLRHNHVVKIYETIETEKHIIIVMELCAGGDLLNYVRKRRRLKEPYAKVIFKQIIDGLCYIHSKFIAHRDIKLDNILLDGKGNVKIADFGVSKQCQRGQLKMTEQCGTPAYIAPEILKDKGYTFSVDLWSAGVVLFAMLYGTVPFKANNMEELHKLIVKGKYVLKDDISIEARNLLRGLLEVNPEKRLTIKQIYRHKWFEDLDPSLQLFNDQERDMIRKEYTYNDPRRYNRNENEEPVDCFTEHNLESVYNSLKNVTTKSIILAPFNSTQSQLMEEGVLRMSVESLVCEKMMVLNFARRCREIDRQYEFNNNGELDNGVYHKFINNSDDQDDSGDERQGDDDVDKDLLCIPMLMSSRRDVQKKGKSSIENSFEEAENNNRGLRGLQERQALAMKIKEGSQISKEIHRNRKQIDNDIDAEMVQTFEEYQTKYSNRLDQEKINKLVQSGYPREYVTKVLEENEPNYCTAGYYLMGMDQNYC